MNAHESLRYLRRSAIAACLTLCAFAAFYSWLAWVEITDRDERQTTLLVEVSAKSLELFFRNVEGSMMTVAETMLDGRGNFDPVRGSEALQRLRRAHPAFGVSVITANDGRVLAASDPAFMRRVPTLALQSGFPRALAELARAPLNLGRAFRGPVSGDWQIPIFYGVRAKDGTLRYLVGTILPVDAAQYLWQGARLPASAALGVAREDGYLVARYPVPDKIQLDVVYGQPRLGGAQLARHPEKAGSFRLIGEFTKTSTVVVFRRMQRIPLTVISSNPMSNRVRDWLDLVWTLWFVAGAAIVGLGAVYAWSRRRQLAWDAEREQRMGELERANLELESFNYTVTHDLRAPVRAIASFGALLRDKHGERLDAEGRQFLDRIIAAGKRMGGQVDHLLRLSRIAQQDCVRESVDLVAMVDDIVAELQAGNPGRRVEVQVAPGLAAYGDPALLRIALQNLLENAWKFTSKSGAARIEVGSHSLDGETAYFVTDNGAGFDMHYADKLFRVFERLHAEDEYPGTGIGLAVVERIVRRHGGRIWARSAPGQGATFNFTLGSA